MKQANNSQGEYVEIFKKLHIFFREKCELRYSSYARTGGLVNFSCYPSNVIQLVSLINQLKQKNLTFRVLGKTTNLLFLDSVEYSCFIYTDFIDELSFVNDTVIVGAGRLLIDFCRDMASRGVTGFEGLEGIPGSVGGALMMNAGAYGYLISDHLYKVKLIDRDGVFQTIDRDALDFGERLAPSLLGCVILECVFKCESGDPHTIERLSRRFHISRHSYQEWVYPNLGSIFVVPGMNINMNALEALFHERKYLKYLIARLLVYLWGLKPLVFIRRTFPEFNFPFRVNEFFIGKCYASKIASRCTINTFTNKNTGSLVILQYMLNVKRCITSSLRLENEVVTDTIHCIKNEIQYINELKVVGELKNEKYP